MNENRIVRIHHDGTHKLILYVARLTKTPYQHVFNEFLEYISEGHVIGELTYLKLMERILEIKADWKDG